MNFRPGVWVGSDLEIEFEAMADEELLDRLENSKDIKELEIHKGWKLIEEACKRTANKARRALEKIDPDDKTMIVKYQQVATLYGSVLQSLINSYKQEGELAFREARGRGLMDKIMRAIKL